MPSRTPTRRALLCGASGALALAAGCISDLERESDPGSDTDAGADDGTNADPEPNGDADETGDGDDGGDGENESADGDSDGSLDYDAVRFRHSETPTDPDAALLRDPDDADDWLAERGLEADDAVDAFVADTDFANATLVSLEADAPSHCYELVLEEVAFDADGAGETAESTDDDDDGGDDPNETVSDGEGEGEGAGDDGIADGTLELEAEVRDTAADNEVCAQALTTVGVLVRASVDSEPVAELSAQLVDDDGSEHGLGVGTASETDSESSDDGTDA